MVRVKSSIHRVTSSGGHSRGPKGSSLAGQLRAQKIANRKASVARRKAERAERTAKKKKDRLNACINRCQASHDRVYVRKRQPTKAQLIAMA